MRHMTSDVELVVVGLQVDCEALRVLEPLLAPDERRRAERFAFARDRRRFMVARARLRQLLAERLGVEPRSVRLRYSRYGKPGLAHPAGDPPLRFNLSHCADIAVYAFARSHEVGVDVEAVRTLPDADALAAHFFSSREKAAYFALDECERPLGFFNCWTRKEAYIKAHGEGLSLPLDQFDVSLAPGESAALLATRSDPREALRWSLQALTPGPNYVAALAVEGQGWHLTCWQWRNTW